MVPEEVFVNYYILFLVLKSKTVIFKVSYKTIRSRSWSPSRKSVPEEVFVNYYILFLVLKSKKVIFMVSYKTIRSQGWSPGRKSAPQQWITQMKKALGKFG